MSAFDFLKEVVETIAVDETTVWGETRHASVGILIAGTKQIRASASSGERNGKATLGQST